LSYLNPTPRTRRTRRHSRGSRYPVCRRLRWAGDFAMTRRRSTGPDRSALPQLLAETEERIAHGEEQIAAQRKLIAELKRQGDARGVTHAKDLLAGLEL